MRRLFVLLSLAASPAVAAPVPTAAPDPALQARLDLADQLHRLPLLIRDSLVPPVWLDGDRVVFWARDAGDGGTWTIADGRTGALTPLISGDALRAQLSQLRGAPVTALQFFEVAVAPDRRAIVFQLDDAAFALGLTGGQVRRLAHDDRAALALSTDHFVAPRGDAIAIQRPTGFAIVHGDARPMLERSNEPGLAWRIPAHPWSPDGRFVVVWRDDTRAVHKIPVVDYTAPLERVDLAPYVKAGTPLVHAELHIIDATTGRVSALEPVGPETYDWFTGWSPDGREALCIHLARDAKRLELTAVEPVTGRRRRVLHDDRPATFVAGLDLEVGGWATQVTALPGDKGYLWMSERDGWRHVYHYARDGRLIRQITQGAFPVHEVVGVDPAGDAVFVLASAEPGAPYDHVLYRTDLRGSPLIRMSSATGMHRIVLSPSARYLVDSWSTRDQPRLRELVATRPGTPRRRLTTADARAATARGYVPPEALVVRAADGATPLYGALYKPRDFVATRRYPVIAYVYGGPFTTAVPWSYVGNAMSLECVALAQLGFVVVLIDPRGGPGRSKAFQDATYGKIGQLEIPDYVTAIRQAAATRPWMDLDRVGIRGHSWGGYFTLRGMLTAPDFFRAGYAGAPGALEEDALVNEPYMGLPSANPAGYAAGANPPLASQLRGALKIMHGTSDVDATLSSTMRMVAALIRANKRVELLVMPGEPHSPGPPADRYYADDVALFFLRTLGDPR